MVKILAALSILNSSGASPGATKKVVVLELALVVAALVTALPLTYYLNVKFNESCSIVVKYHCSICNNLHSVMVPGVSFVIKDNRWLFNVHI